MQTVRMITTKVHTYAQKQLRVGEVFEAEPHHVKMLLATGRAELPPIHTREITNEGKTSDLPVRTPKHDRQKEK